MLLSLKCLCLVICAFQRLFIAFAAAYAALLLMLSGQWICLSSMAFIIFDAHAYHCSRLHDSPPADISLASADAGFLPLSAELLRRYFDVSKRPGCAHFCHYACRSSIADVSFRYAIVIAAILRFFFCFDWLFFRFSSSDASRCILPLRFIAGCQSFLPLAAFRHA